MAEEEWAYDTISANKSRFSENSRMRKALRRKKQNQNKMYVIGPTEPIFKHYRMGDAIGHPGQFGRAREARRIKDGVLCAVKIIAKKRFRHLTNVQAVWQDLRTEIELLKSMDHPNICKIYDVFEDKFNLYLVLEHLGGGELYDRIVERNRYHEKDSKPIIKQMLEGISYLHQNRIVHCDLKPDNFLFDSEDNLKIIDFGMSKRLPRMKFLHDLVGTPYYTAPEVIEGNYTHSADIWSIGVVMFVSIFGYPPFYVDPEEWGHLEHQEIFKQIKKGFNPIVHPGMGHWFPEEIKITDEARDLISKMLAFNPEDRPTAQEALDHLWFTKHSVENVLPPTVISSLQKFTNNCSFATRVCTTFMDTLRSDEYENAKQAFLEMDLNNDGTVTYEEFSKVLVDEMKMPEDKVKEMFDQVDINHDNSISYRELVTALTFEHIRAADERLYVTFCDLDVDDDGFIAPEELLRVMAEHKVKTSAKNARKLVASADKNADGQIDFQEFLQAMHPEIYSDIRDAFQGETDGGGKAS